MNKNSLVVDPPMHIFEAAAFNNLQKRLVDLDNNTIRAQIASVHDIEFAETGRLKANDFAFSSLPMQQLCSYVAKGLWSLVADLSGAVKTQRAFEGLLSVPQAVRVLNQCVQLRFRAPGGLAGRDMIQNHASKTVDGVVGNRYRYFPNHHLVECVQEVVSSEADLQFREAFLVGRRLSIVFRHPRVLATAHDNVPLYGGCYFTNSEAGECGVRGAPVLFYGDDLLRCLGTLRHIGHHGKDFMKKLSNMLGVVLDQQAIETVAHLVDRKLAEPLQILTGGRDIHPGRRRQLELRLERYVEKRLAADIIRRAIFMGADGTRVPTTISASTLGKRTKRDLFVTLIKVAADTCRHPNVRELLERAAFDLLLQTT